VICRLCHYMVGRWLAEMADGRTNVRYPHGRGPVAGPSFRPGPGRAGRGREGLAGGGNHGPFRLMEIVGTDGGLGVGDLGLARKYSDAGAVDAF
jgi:hypothetical protein